MTSRKQDESADPRSALTDYLDELLHAGTSQASEPGGASESVPMAPAVSKRLETEAQKRPQRQWDEPRPRVMMAPLTAAPADKPKPAPRRVETPPKKETVSPVETRIKPELKKATEAPVAKPEKSAETVTRKYTDTPPKRQPVQPEKAEPAQPQGRPDWAGERFECLIFKVAGLQLAVPLVLLGAIHRLEGDLTAIPGRPDWYLGMLPIGDRNVRVVDTAAWVMAGRYPQGAADNYRLVIRLDDSDWGLACDEVAQSFTLNPEDVKWRQVGGKRPWLAGTVVKHMCALIDVGAMARLLARAEREHRLELD